MCVRVHTCVYVRERETVGSAGLWRTPINHFLKKTHILLFLCVSCSVLKSQLFYHWLNYKQFPAERSLSGYLRPSGVLQTPVIVSNIMLCLDSFYNQLIKPRSRNAQVRGSEGRMLLHEYPCRSKSKLRLNFTNPSRNKHTSVFAMSLKDKMQ